MSIEDHFLLFYASDYVDISIGNNDSFGIIWQIIEIVELLDLVRLILKVK